MNILQPKRFINKYGKEELPKTIKIVLKLLKVSLPAALETLLLSVVGVVDTMMVGSCGTQALAAVSLSQQPIFITLAIAMGLVAGITAIVSRRKGEGDRIGANKCVRQSILISIIIGALITLLLAKPFLLVAQAQEDTIDLAVLYFRIVSSVLVFNYIRLSICAALRACGNTTITLITNIVANVVNIFLNYCLIGGHFGFPELGVAGAAIATAIGNTVSCLIAVFVIFVKIKHKKETNLDFIKVSFKDNWRFDREVITNIIKVSIPAFIEQLFMRIGFFIIAMIVNSLGTEVTAMNAIISGIISLSFSITDGFAIGCASLVGSSLGEKKRGLALAYARLSQISSFILGCIMIALIFVFRYDLSRLYSTDDNIINGASSTLYFAVFVIYPQSLQWVTTGALRGAGDVKFTARTSMISVAIIRPILSFLLCHPIGLGLLGSWIGMFLDQSIRFIVNDYRLTHLKWMDIKV